MVKAKDLQSLFIILYDNNAYAYNTAFTNAGYNVPSSPVDARDYVIKKMYDLYISSSPDLRTIMGQVPWNPNAGNYTTDPAIRQRVMGYLSVILFPAGSSEKLNIDWDNVQSWLFGNQQNIVSQTTTTPPSNIGAIIGYSLTGIALVVLLIMVLRQPGMNGRTKIILISVGLLVLGIVAYFIYRSTSTSGTTSTSTTTTSGTGGLAGLLGNAGNLGGSLTGIFGGIGGFFGNLFGGGGGSGSGGSQGPAGGNTGQATGG